MVVDELAREVGGGFKKHGRARAQVLEGRLGIGGPKVVLAKPLTYMNTSGGPVSALAQFYDINPDRIIAVHDELDIPFDTIKLKIGGGEGAPASVVLPDAWTPQTSCSSPSVAPKRRTCPSSSQTQRMQP